MAIKFRQKAKIAQSPFLARHGGIFSHFTGLVNSNVLPAFAKELRELPWQPNLSKKAKIAQISIPCKKSRSFLHVH